MLFVAVITISLLSIEDAQSASKFRIPDIFSVEKLPKKLDKKRKKKFECKFEHRSLNLKY